MRRLTSPTLDFETTLAKCLDGISNVSIKGKYLTNLPFSSIFILETTFKVCAARGNLYTLPNMSNKKPNDLVYKNLEKLDLIKLYTQYFVPEKKPARFIYDQLKITSDGKCPLCGGIGHVRTLDHYLAKANFPIYSVMPSNLVPCCRDCNTEKNDFLATKEEEQTLHPYFDDKKFFDQQWVAARVIQSSPPILEYYVSPPPGWSVIDKKRVNTHFREYGLAERFGVEAGADLPETIMIKNTILKNCSPEEFADYLYEKSNNLNLPINHWRRVMFSSLAKDHWFCNHSH